MRSRSQELSTLSDVPAFEMCHWCLTRPCCVAQCTPLASSAGRCSTACVPGPASTTRRHGHSCKGLSRTRRPLSAHISPTYCPRPPTSCPLLALHPPCTVTLCRPHCRPRASPLPARHADRVWARISVRGLCAGAVPGVAEAGAPALPAARPRLRGLHGAGWTTAKQPTSTRRPHCSARGPL